MEQDAYKDRVKIKAFHADNGVFKALMFRINKLENNIKR